MFEKCNILLYINYFKQQLENLQRLYSTFTINQFSSIIGNIRNYLNELIFMEHAKICALFMHKYYELKNTTENTKFLQNSSDIWNLYFSLPKYVKIHICTSFWLPF